MSDNELDSLSNSLSMLSSSDEEHRRRSRRLADNDVAGEVISASDATPENGTGGTQVGTQNGVVDPSDVVVAGASGDGDDAKGKGRDTSGDVLVATTCKGASGSGVDGISALVAASKKTGKQSMADVVRNLQMTNAQEVITTYRAKDASEITKEDRLAYKEALRVVLPKAQYKLWKAAKRKQVEARKVSRATDDADPIRQACLALIDAYKASDKGTHTALDRRMYKGAMKITLPPEEYRAWKLEKKQKKVSLARAEREEARVLTAATEEEIQEALRTIDRLKGQPKDTYTRDTYDEYKRAKKIVLSDVEYRKWKNQKRRHHDERLIAKNEAHAERKAARRAARHAGGADSGAVTEGSGVAGGSGVAAE